MVGIIDSNQLGQREAYKITCRTTKKVYYGMSCSVPTRMKQHASYKEYLILYRGSYKAIHHIESLLINNNECVNILGNVYKHKHPSFITSLLKYDHLKVNTQSILFEYKPEHLMAHFLEQINIY